MNLLTTLPTVNACLNAASGVLLVLGFLQIRRKNVRLHRRLMIGAFLVSVLFLVLYLVYHFNVGSVRFTGQGWVRPLYFTILLTHTLLAAAVPVLALITLYRAARGDFRRHRRIARWTLPIWLYVSVTGVLVYLFLYQIYPRA